MPDRDPEQEMERAVELAKVIEKHPLPAKSSWGYDNALAVRDICRALIACREPVEIKRRMDGKPLEFPAIPHECPSCKTTPVYMSHRFCPFCGKEIKWTD